MGHEELSRETIGRLYQVPPALMSLQRRMHAMEQRQREAKVAAWLAFAASLVAKSSDGSTSVTPSASGRIEEGR